VKDGECVNCNLCEMICPDFAIYSVPAPEGGSGPGGSVSEADKQAQVPERGSATKGESH